MPEAPSILDPKPEPPFKARIRRVGKRVLEGRGKVSVGEAMRQEGYSEATANNPQQLTASKTWNELMDAHLSTDTLAKKHEALLGAAKIDQYQFGMNDEDEAIKEIVESVPGCRLVHIKMTSFGKIAYFQTADNKSQLAALDMAYKLRGSYAAEKHHNTNLNFSLAELRKMRDAGEI